MDEETKRVIRDTHEAVIRLEAKAHDPISCPAMKAHEANHGRTLKIVGAFGGVVALVIALIKLSA